MSHVGKRGAHARACPVPCVSIVGSGRTRGAIRPSCRVATTVRRQPKATLMDTRCLSGREFGRREERRARHAGEIRGLERRECRNQRAGNGKNRPRRRRSVAGSATTVERGVSRHRHGQPQLKISVTRHVGRTPTRGHRPVRTTHHRNTERCVNQGTKQRFKPRAAHAPNGDKADERTARADQGRRSLTHTKRKLSAGCRHRSGFHGYGRYRRVPGRFNVYLGPAKTHCSGCPGQHVKR